jgi:hypothetical protein
VDNYGFDSFRNYMAEHGLGIPCWTLKDKIKEKTLDFSRAFALHRTLPDFTGIDVSLPVISHHWLLCSSFHSFSNFLDYPHFNVNRPNNFSDFGELTGK